MSIFLRVFLSIVFVLAGIYVFIYTENEGYTYIFIHPLLYSVFFFSVYYKSLSFTRVRPFLLVFTIIGFFRYVALPVLIVTYSYYGGRSHVVPSEYSFESAIFLMGWELIVCSFLIIYLEKKFYTPADNEGFNSVSGNLYVFFVFFLSAIFLLILVPKSISFINFISPSAKVDAVEADTLTNLIVYVFLVSKSILIVSIIGKVKSVKLKFGYLFVLLLMLLNIMIYSGTNKSNILISGFAGSLLLYKLYGKKSIYSMAIIGVFSFVAVSLVNQYRDPTSISGGVSKGIDRTDMVQVYTGGAYNVAIALETKQFYPESTKLEVLFFDVFRPMLGVNMLLKGQKQIYSNIYFNNRMWTHIDRRSQIIPMVGQANLFLGSFLAPLFSVFFICLAYCLERISQRTNYAIVYYFVLLSMIRLGFMFGQNTMNMINDLSMNLFLFLFVFLLSKYLSRVSR